MPVDFSVTNQLASPAIYASSFATRPTASFKGRLFVDTDNPSTGIYRDTGTAWVAIAGTSVGEIQSLNDVCVVGNSTTLLGIEIYGQSAFGENNIAPYGQIPPFSNYQLTVGNYSEFESSIYTVGNNFFSSAGVSTIIEGKVRIGDTTSPTSNLDVVGNVILGWQGTSNIKFDGNNATFDFYGSGNGNYAKFNNGDVPFFVGINTTPTKALDVVGDVQNVGKLFSHYAANGIDTENEFFTVLGDVNGDNNVTKLTINDNLQTFTFNLGNVIMPNLKITSLQNFATNALAISGGLTVGQLYYTNVGGQATVKIVI